MTKRMLIDATHPEETRVVVLDGNRLDDFDVETSTKQQLKGNIYLAKVTRVEPSLQAAFVEYGGNRHGFLAFSEIHPDYYQIPVADREALLAEHAAAGETEEAPMRAPPGEGDGEEGVETVGGDEIEEAQRRQRRPYRNYKIQEVVKRRQIMLVQVVKEERGNKGAALTTYLSLAGRYCVLMPNTARGGGISRKITNLADRKRLKSVLTELEIPEGMAVIVRTAGAERGKLEVKRDCEYLLRLWDEVRELTLKSTAPALVYEEANLIKRSIRDLYSKDIEEVMVEGEEGYKAAKTFMRMLMPSHAKRVQPYRDPAMPLFHRFQVESQLDAIHGTTVQLRSGGYVVINPTEALVSIDVNSGRATRERNIEETAYKTNIEAADEIARQLRLRDLAGLIVIDFIDMEDTRNQHAVERRMKEALKNDRARIQVGRISHFGLLEMSRQRLRPSLIETSTQACPHCGGSGVIRSTESTALHVLRAIEEEGIRLRTLEVLVYAPTKVALYILNQKRAALAEIENRYGLHTLVAADDALIPPDYRLERTKVRAPGDELPRPMLAPVPVFDEDEAEDEALAAEEEAATQERTEVAAADGAAAEDGGRRRRRRRRRRRNGEEGRPAAQPAGEAIEGEMMPALEADEGPPQEGGVEGQAEGEAEDEAEGEAAETDSAAEESGDQPRKKRRRGKRGGRRRGRREDELSPMEGEEALPVRDEILPVNIAVDITADALPEPQPEPEPEPVSAVEAEEPAPVEKPKRRRTRKAAAPEAAVEPEMVAEPPAAPPKRSRSRKPKVAAEPAAAEAQAEAVPAEPEPVAPEPKPEPVLAPVLVTEAAGLLVEERRAVSSAPIEVVKVDAPEAADQPRRKGWWSKILS